MEAHVSNEEKKITPRPGGTKKNASYRGRGGGSGVGRKGEKKMTSLLLGPVRKE